MRLLWRWAGSVGGLMLMLASALVAIQRQNDPPDILVYSGYTNGISGLHALIPGSTWGATLTEGDAGAIYSGQSADQIYHSSYDPINYVDVAVYRVQSNGLDFRRIYNAPNIQQVLVSQDAVAFLYGIPPRIYLTPPAGGEPIRLPRALPIQYQILTPIFFSQDGQWIFFNTQDSRFRSDLWRVRVDGQVLENLTEDMPQTVTLSGIQPTGSQWLIVDIEGVLHRLDTTENPPTFTRLFETDLNVGQETVDFWLPAPGIILTRAADGNKFRVRAVRLADLQPLWSYEEVYFQTTTLDQQWVVVQSAKRGGTVYRFRPAGTGEQGMGQSTQNFQFWGETPDGRSFLYVNRNAIKRQDELWQVPVNSDDGEISLLRRDHLRLIAWHPAGEGVVMEETLPSGTAQLLWLPFDGRAQPEKVQILRQAGQGYFEFAAWANPPEKPPAIWPLLIVGGAILFVLAFLPYRKIMALRKQGTS